MESNSPDDLQPNKAEQQAPNQPKLHAPIDQEVGVVSTNQEANNPPLDLIVVIPTMRRWTRERQPAPEKYLTNLVDGLVGSLTAQEREHTKFLLYNVDKEPEKHTEVDELKKRHGVLIESQNKPQKKDKQEHQSDEPVVLQGVSGEIKQVSHGTMEWIAGETHDATSVLFDARKRAPYVMFLEDDVKPTAHAITKITDYVAEMKHKGIEDWFMVDLYTPRIDWGRNPLQVSNFERYDYECCTQAMLFRSDKLLDLLVYETLHPNLPIDDNIRDFSRESDVRGVYAILPNLFEHVGRFSSNPEKSSETVEHTSINFVP